MATTYSKVKKSYYELGIIPELLASKEIINEMYQIKPPFNVNRAALAAGVEAIKDYQWTKKAIKHNNSTIRCEPRKHCRPNEKHQKHLSKYSSYCGSLCSHRRDEVKVKTYVS